METVNQRHFLLFSVCIMRLQEDGTQRGTQCQRIQCRNTDCYRHRQTELTVERTGSSRHETYRDKHGHHHQGNGNNGTAQFTHRINGGLTCRLVTRIQLGMNTLDDDYRIIDDYRDSQNQSTKGQQVYTESNQIQTKESTHQCHRNRNRRNQRGTEVLQEDIYNDEHEDKCLNQGFDYFMYGSKQKVVHIHQLHNLHAGRQGLLCFFQIILNILDNCRSI